ncbi:MAG: heme ABC exporter ATP-binding protein CcmA [Pseudomonadota bacterium]
MTLVVEDLVCRRGGRVVCGPLSFRVAPGETLLVTGPNGAGKSSLLRVLAGFIPAAEGQMRLEGSRPAAGAALAEQVAFAGHLDAVKPALGVAENLVLWARLGMPLRGQGDAGAAVQSALSRFGLAHMAERPAAECSAGQKRRLGLARLLLTDRPVWLLDEPTVSLDRASAALVAVLIGEHAATGGITLVTSHVDLGLASAREFSLAPTSAAAPAPGAPTATTAATGATPAPPRPADDPFLEGSW